MLDRDAAVEVLASTLLGRGIMKFISGTPGQTAAAAAAAAAAWRFQSLATKISDMLLSIWFVSHSTVLTSSYAYLSFIVARARRRPDELSVARVWTNLIQNLICPSE
jgi:hypothetical protein